jgi:hypothetical protein
MLATLPPEPLVVTEQVCVSFVSEKPVQISFSETGIFSVCIPAFSSNTPTRTILLKPRTPTEAGARLLRMARPIHWPQDESDTDTEY